MIPAYERDGIRLYVGDCREVVPQLGIQFSAVCTDPPYGLGFMGKDWDHEVPGEAFWRVFSDAMLPGGHLLSFGGSRTFHRIAVAIEDAGFEIRDTLMWLYGQGFPKSLDVSKAIDKTRRRDYVLAAIDLGLNIPGNSLHDWTKAEHSPGDVWWEKFKAHLSEDDWQRIERRVIGHGHRKNDRDAVSIKLGRVSDDYDITAPATPEAERWQGWGTALKPAYEPIIMARKPLTGTVAQNVLEHGTGALNIDGCRIGSGDDRASGGATGKRVDASEGYSGAWADADSGRDRPTGGRWPANVILDEHAAALLDEQSGERKAGVAVKRNGVTGTDGTRAYGAGVGTFPVGTPDVGYGDTGGASRFFKVAQDDTQCLLCLRTYAPNHDITNATQEVAGCNHASNAALSSCQNESHNGSAPDNAQARQPLNGGGSGARSNTPARTVESGSPSTPGTIESTAPTSAAAPLEELLVPRVRSAANLCDSCVIATAQSLARALQGQTPASLHGLDSMPSSSASILIRSLASYAEPMVNTGIIPTTASLSTLFGSVAHAIAANISRASDDPNTGYVPTRFLYQSKASRAERNAGLDGLPDHDREGQSSWAGVCNVCGCRMMLNGKTTCGHGDMRWVVGKPQKNHHPTVKPLALMRWLLTLVTPPGGIVLDPFAGSGSTLVACAQLGIPAYGIDMNEEYIEIAARRIDHALDERGREEAKPRQLNIAD